MPISTPMALARRILRQLREAGYSAYLVGGCVRDLLLGIEPKDVDVATGARPDELLRLFPKADCVGAHFGVVLVKEDGGAAAVEVATFRSDHAYRDGRRPEGVTFETDPRRDALRRDFTINAMMMDPETGELLDFAGGRADLAARLIRAVGDPAARFGEDHLRMLRAVRFAARLGFAIEQETFDAIRSLAPRIQSISAERIREELIRILTERGRRRGLELLAETGLMSQIMPEVTVDEPLLAMIGAMRQPVEEPALALAVLLHGVGAPSRAKAVLGRLRCSADTMARVLSLLESQPRFAGMGAMSLSELKRFLRTDRFDQHLELLRLHCEATGREWDGYDFACARRAEFSTEQLWPPKLLTGEDLIALGLTPGPDFKRLLEAAETGQLEGRLTTREQALQWLKAAEAYFS